MEYLSSASVCKGMTRRRAPRRRFLLALTCAFAASACAGKIVNEIDLVTCPEDETSYPIPGRGRVCVSKDYGDYLTCMAEAGVKKVALDKAAGSVVEGEGGYGPVDARLKAEWGAVLKLQAEYEKGDSLAKMKECSADFRKRRGLSGDTDIAKKPTDPFSKTADEEGVCVFKVGDAGGDVLYRSPNGQYSADCLAVQTFTCKGLQKGKKYKARASGGVNVESRDLEKRFGDWPRWTILRLTAGGQEESCDPTGKQTTTLYDDETRADVAVHRVQLCSAAHVPADSISVHICQHRCKQGDGTATCTLKDDFEVSVFPE